MRINHNHWMATTFFCHYWHDEMIIFGQLQRLVSHYHTTHAFISSDSDSNNNRTKRQKNSISHFGMPCDYTINEANSLKSRFLFLKHCLTMALNKIRDKDEKKKTKNNISNRLRMYTKKISYACLTLLFCSLLLLLLF